MKTRTYVSILILVLAVLIMIVLPWSQVYSGDSDKSRPKGDVIFEIGKEDKSNCEFRANNFKGQPEYSCRVGVDCSTATFPRGQYTGEPQRGFKKTTVESIIIYFNLMRDFKELVLRLARTGSETTVVSVDGTQVYTVTSVMLRSDEFYTYGAYNLSLGSLDKGTHTIEITVADDGKGDGFFGWDALALIAQ